MPCSQMISMNINPPRATAERNVESVPNVKARIRNSGNRNIGSSTRHSISANATKETTPENFNDKLAEFARKNAVDPAAALAALNDARLAGLVERDFQDGVARGVAKTPTLFVSGKPFIETFSFEELCHALDDALAGR